MIVASLIVIAVVALAANAIFFVLLRDHAVERSRLLDRIQAPEAVRLSAFEQTAPETAGRAFPTPEEVVPPSSWDDDLSLIPEDDTP